MSGNQVYRRTADSRRQKQKYYGVDIIKDACIHPKQDHKGHIETIEW